MLIAIPSSSFAFCVVFVCWGGGFTSVHKVAEVLPASRHFVALDSLPLACSCLRVNDAGGRVEHGLPFLCVCGMCGCVPTSLLATLSSAAEVGMDLATPLRPS